MKTNKFTPTRAWRKRQKLHTLLGRAAEHASCFDLDMERRDWDSLEFNMRELRFELSKAEAFYQRHK